MSTQFNLQYYLKVELLSLKKNLLDFIFITFSIFYIIARMLWFLVFGDKNGQRPDIDDPISEGDIISNHFRMR